MKVTKTIRLLESDDLEVIEEHAKNENVTTNELLRMIISDYAIQLREKQASDTLHAYIDDLIAANNNLVLTTNYNTVVIGETLKVFLDKLEKLVGDSDSDFKNMSQQLDQLTNKRA